MKITRIENSKHVQERVLVFLEGGDLLRITGAELLRFGLYKGMDLSPALVVELQAAAQQSQLKQTAARMASGRMLSKKEVQRRLTKKGATEEQAADTADWLETLGAVDDEAPGAVGRGAGTAAPGGGCRAEGGGCQTAWAAHDTGGKPEAGRGIAAAWVFLE